MSFSGTRHKENHENPVPGASRDHLGRLLVSLGSPSEIFDDFRFPNEAPRLPQGSPKGAQNRSKVSKNEA